MNAVRARGLDVAVCLMLLFAPFWMNAIGGYTELATRIVVMGLAAMSLNFLLGFTGVLSFGHAAYFGLGAYGTAMAIKYWGVGSIPAIVLGVIVATIAAMIIGALIIKLRGVYFAMVTIAFGQVFYFIAFRWNAVTGGDDGLTGWRRLPINFGFAELDIVQNDRAFYYFALAIFAVCVAAMAVLLNSPFGRSLIAIRENERRARFLGVPIEFHVWLSFVISCLFVSVAGGLYALLNNFIDPRALRVDLSGNLVIMAVLGGMRSFWGPLIGAAIFVALQDYVSSHTQNWMSVIGLVFVLVVRFFPRGVLGMLRTRSEGVTLLQVEGASKRFGSLVAIDDVSLDHRAGRIARDHRSERRRQDDVLQSGQRPVRADRGLDPVRGPRHRRARSRRAGAARHVPHLPDHRDLSRALGRRQHPRRGRGRVRLSPPALAWRGGAGGGGGARR